MPLFPTLQSWIIGSLRAFSGIFLPLSGVLLMLYLVGWHHPEDVQHSVFLMVELFALAYAVVVVAGGVLSLRRGESFTPRTLAIQALAALIGITLLLEIGFEFFTSSVLLPEWFRGLLLIIATLQQTVGFVVKLLEGLPYLQSNILRYINSEIIFLISFLGLIAVGACLLRIPRATVDGISWIDAVFTSTSAVCVTGLSSVDTQHAFTPLGEAIILFLIQMGGFGIVTVTFFVATVSGRGLSIASSLLVRNALNLNGVENLGTMLRFVVLFTLAVEALGALSLGVAWSISGYAVENLPWVCVFHSVSAFCNAGFSTFSEGLAHPSATENVLLQATIMMLIILGGIGFPVLYEICLGSWRGFRGRGWPVRLSIQTQVTLGVTLALIVGGAALLYAAEASSAAQAGRNLVLDSLFNSVTARTAGFNTMNIGSLTLPAVMVVIFLMFIGGSPGGLAGGIRTSTFAVALANVRRILFSRNRMEVIDRSLEEAAAVRAFGTVTLALIWISSGTLVLIWNQPEIAPVDGLFEIVSAFCTVGLTRGVTFGLSDANKLLVSLTMFVGRIGVTNFFLALLILRQSPTGIEKPAEKLIVE